MQVPAAGTAPLLVTDRSYLRWQRQWRERVAQAVFVRLTRIETDAVVPVEVASQHLQFAARTLRPGLLRHLPTYLVPLQPEPVAVTSVQMLAGELESARTHAPYWNAAQKEMLLTGRMHNTMRMYWSKKILQWSRTPQEAFATALRLNNACQLDGRDANFLPG